MSYLKCVLRSVGIGRTHMELEKLVTQQGSIWIMTWYGQGNMLSDLEVHWRLEIIGRDHKGTTR